MMKPYSEYKPSGVEWLSDVPSHWERIAIKFLASKKNTLFIDGDWVESKDLSDEGIRYITTGNVGLGIYKEKGKGFISEEKFQELNCTEVFEGDMLISRLNSPIGRACLVPNLNNKIITSVDNVIVRPNPQYSKRYLVYLFSSHEYISNTENLARGATMQRISRGMLGNIRITIPNSLDEQEKIADYLDVKVGRVDSLLFEKENFIKLLQEKRQALISHVVTKGLDDNVKMKPSGVDWIGDIPTLWETSSLRWRIKIRSGDSLANDQFEKVSDDLNAIPVVGGNGLMAYTKQPNSYGSRIIIGRVGSHCGNVHKVNYPSWITDNALIVDTWNGFDQDFLIHLLRTLKINDLANKTALPLITGNQVKSIIVPIPPQEEQQEIVQFLHDKLSVIDQLIIETESSIKLLQEHRTALISAAVTGKIDVREVA